MTMDKIILLCLLFPTLRAQTETTTQTQTKTDSPSSTPEKVDAVVEVGLMPANVSEVPEGGYFSFTCAADRFKAFSSECVVTITVSRCFEEDCASVNLFKDVLVVYNNSETKTVTKLGDNVRFESSKPINTESGCQKPEKLWTVLHVSRAKKEDAGLYRCAVNPGGGLPVKELIARITLYKPRIITPPPPQSSGVCLKPAAIALASLNIALLMLDQ